MAVSPVAALALSLVLLGAALTGCGGSAAEDASTRVCDSRDDIAKHVDTLKGLTLATVTRDQVKQSFTAIRKDLSEIKGARADLADDRRKEVDAANEEFSAALKDTVGSVGKSISLQTAAADVKQSFQSLATAYESSFGQIDCS